MIHFLGIMEHPVNAIYCKGSTAVLNCTVFDNSTNNAADLTGWFNNSVPPIAVQTSMISNTRNGDDMVTSVVTIRNVSLNDNGTGLVCVPSFGVLSYAGIISVAGNYEHLVVTYLLCDCIHTCLCFSMYIIVVMLA